MEYCVPGLISNVAVDYVSVTVEFSCKRASSLNIRLCGSPSKDQSQKCRSLFTYPMYPRYQRQGKRRIRYSQAQNGKMKENNNSTGNSTIPYPKRFGKGAPGSRHFIAHLFKTRHYESIRRALSHVVAWHTCKRKNALPCLVFAGSLFLTTFSMPSFPSVLWYCTRQLVQYNSFTRKISGPRTEKVSCFNGL